MSDFRTHPEYHQLTDQEKKFLDLYLDVRSESYLKISESVLGAFNFAPDNANRALAYGRGVISRVKIKKIIEDELKIEQPLPTREEFLLAVWKQAQGKDSKIVLGALQLYADISGWRNKSAPKKSAADDGDEDSPLLDLVYTDKNNGEVDSSEKE